MAELEAHATPERGMTTSLKRRLAASIFGGNEGPMSKIILSYPDGVAGAALLLMRFSSALAAWPAFTQISQRSDHWLTVIASALAVAALIAGLFTRPVAVLLVIAIIACVASDANGRLLLWLSSAGATASLALIGPGAFSIDAHRYGRRVIRLTPHSPDWGGRD